MDAKDRPFAYNTELMYQGSVFYFEITAGFWGLINPFGARLVILAVKRQKGSL